MHVIYILIYQLNRDDSGGEFGEQDEDDSDDETEGSEGEIDIDIIGIDDIGTNIIINWKIITVFELLLIVSNMLR